MNKRAALRTLGATEMAIMLTTSPVWPADAFPNRPIKLVVPYAAGGTIDNIARILSPKLQALLKQPVIVENRAGVGTTIGADAVARADADGYTIFLGSNTAFTISPQIMPKVNYDPLKSNRHDRFISQPDPGQARLAVQDLGQRYRSRQKIARDAFICVLWHRQHGGNLRRGDQGQRQGRYRRGALRERRADCASRLGG